GLAGPPMRPRPLVGLAVSAGLHAAVLGAGIALISHDAELPPLMIDLTAGAATGGAAAGPGDAGAGATPPGAGAGSPPTRPSATTARRARPSVTTAPAASVAPPPVSPPAPTAP